MHFSVSLSDTLEQLSSCDGGERGENCAEASYWLSLKVSVSVPTPRVYGITSLRSHLNPQPHYRALLQLLDTQKPIIQEANVREKESCFNQKSSNLGTR